MKITIKRALLVGDYNGKDILKIEEGTLVQIVGADKYHSDDVGKILLRTDSDKQPLVCLSDGHLWGCMIENYTFRQVQDYEFILR